MKNIFLKINIFLMSLPVFVFGAVPAFNPQGNQDTGKKLITSVDDLGTTVYGVVKSGMTLARVGISLIVFTFAVLGWFMGSNYVKKKAEQNNGQEPPSIIRYGIPLLGVVAGIIIGFSAVGSFGMVFLDLTMSESWEWGVTSVLKAAAGL